MNYLKNFKNIAFWGLISSIVIHVYSLINPQFNSRLIFVIFVIGIFVAFFPAVYSSTKIYSKEKLKKGLVAFDADTWKKQKIIINSFGLYAFFMVFFSNKIIGWNFSLNSILFFSIVWIAFFYISYQILRLNEERVQNIADLHTICQSCNTELELDWLERIERKFICPKCNSENTIE